MTYNKKKSNVLELQKMDVKNNKGIVARSTLSNFLCVGTPSMVSQFNCGNKPGW